jgi:uncharacterized repeat protein (TIGR01451 family)
VNPGSSMNVRRRGDGSGSRRIGRLAALALFALALLAAAAPASASGPAWRIDSVANTTVAPGGTLRYELQLRNVGDAVADGLSGDPFILTATLPSGVTAQSITVRGGLFDPSFIAWSCSGDGGGPVTGSSTVTCTIPDQIFPQSSILAVNGFGLIPAEPTLAVNVAPGTTGTFTAAFSVSGGGAAPASTVDATRASSDPPGFGIDAFDAQVAADAAGATSTGSGEHPYGITTTIDFNTTTTTRLAPPLDDLWPVEPVRDIVTDLPPGFVGDPSQLAQCTASELAHVEGGFVPRSLCPPTSQVGTVMLRLNGQPFNPNVMGPIPVYNMVPPPDRPARFGFNVEGTVATLDATVRSGGDYGLTVTAPKVPEPLGIAGTTVTFWGVPADSSHDTERACAGEHQPWNGGPTCTSGARPTAFLRNPTTCVPDSVGLATTVRLDSWDHPGAFTPPATSVSHLPPTYPQPPESRGPVVGLSGCEKLPFDPKLTAVPVSSQADSPSGLTVELTMPQTNDPSALAEADLKKAVVTLPAGVHVAPPSANGLGACSSSQIGLLGTDFPAPSPIHFTPDAPACPDNAKIGTVRIETPLLPQPLTGSVYLAAPHDNPFGSLLAIYLVAEGSGVVVKLPGRIDADPASGQLTTTFDDNPQLPFTKLHLEFNGGPRAALATPSQCGTYTTHAELTSWSGKTVSSDSSFAIDANSDGTPCAAPGFSPGFSAGTLNPVAGGDTSFLLRLTRGDRDQELGSVTVDMPSGVTGRIASAVLCPEAAAAAGTCGDGSLVGTIAVGAGAGSNPFYITNGRAYLTGPYKGAPFGLSMVVPAVAGPFDLGNVVVRAAIFVDRRSTRLRVVSDPLPRILQGIPLELRDVRVAIDRPRFIVNPTSCAVKRIFGTIGSTLGAIAHGSSRFQVGECARLRLAPRLTLTVGSRGHTRGGASTPLSTTLTQTPGQANLGVVSVVLPSTLNARLAVLNRACTLAEFDAGRCSSRARAGSAVALTPLLRDPLRGSAFFVKNPRRVLPDLMVALRGQVSVDLVGKVGVNPRTNQLTTRFDTIPDVPITRFTLRLVAGANGPLGVVRNLCSASAKRATAAIGFRGQNGALVQVNQRLRVRGCPRGRRR